MGAVDITPVDEAVRRQQLEAVAHFIAWESAAAEAARHSGGMVWKHVKGRDYLVRTSRTGGQTGLGPRSEATEQRFDAFHAGRTLARERLAQAREQLERDRRANRALRVGDVPAAGVEFLSALQRAGLAGAVVVAGAAALHAYAAAAGVRVRLRPVAAADALPEWLLAVDERAWRAGGPARIAGLFPRGAHPAPACVPVRAAGAAHDRDWLAGAARLSEPIIGSDGRVARMHAVDPRALVLHLDWCIAHTPCSPAALACGVIVAEAIERLLEAHLPQWRFGARPAAP